MSGQVMIQLPKVYPNRANSKYANRPIVQRTPYIMQSDLILTVTTLSASFPEGSFLHNQDYPFEVASFRPNVTSLDTNSLPQADPNIGDLFRWVRLAMKLIGAARDMTKFNSRLSAIVDLDNRQYNFDSPMYLEKQEGFDITVSHNVPVGSAAGGIRMEIGFKGSLLDFGG